MFDMEEKLLRNALLELINLASSIVDRIDGKPEPAKEREVCPFCNKSLAGKVQIRGVHSNCYRKIARDGDIAKAEKEGILLPEQPRGPKPGPTVDDVVQEGLAKTRTQLASRKKKS